MMRIAIGLLSGIILFSCKTREKMKDVNTIGSIERIDADLRSVLDETTEIEVLAQGYEWSEGPVWVEEHQMLLFSDVPKNTVYKWTEEKGVEEYLTPSGYTGEGQYSNEPGSNGLTLNPERKLVLCQHGDRRIALMDAPLDAPAPRFISLAEQYQGKRFNSPNDAVFRSNGDLFFTDPPYGLPKQAEDPTREIAFNGVYKLSQGEVSLLADSLTRPNGIAFLPGEKTILVANSDPAKATWYAFDLGDHDEVIKARVFYDATANAKTGEKGLPDGLTVDKRGNVYATGPGGVWIFNREGKVLGKIRISVPTANCALTDDEKTLFITADMYLLRVKLKP
jgi:gluconolactonase